MKYGLRSSRKDDNDFSSVKLWAASLNETGNLLLHHEQDETGNFLLAAHSRDVSSFRSKKMHKSHRASIELNVGQIQTEEHGKVWSFPSQMVPSTFYRIIKIKDACSCKLVCRSCMVCPDMYECSCDFSIVNDSACKHAHLIHRFYNDNTTSDVGDMLQFSPVPKFSSIRCAEKTFSAENHGRNRSSINRFMQYNIP